MCLFQLWLSQGIYPVVGLLGPAAAAAAKSLQSCPTLGDPIDSLLPGSSVPGILQARTLEWIAISFSNAWKWKVKVKSLSHVQLLATPWTAAYQAPPSMGVSRPEYWSRVPLPSLLLGPIVVLFLVFQGISILFSIVAVSTYIPTNSAKVFPFLTSSLAFIVCRFFFFFDDVHSLCSEVISHCSFNFHFPNNEWVWTSFHVFICHLYVFFGEKSL